VLLERDSFLDVLAGPPGRLVLIGGEAGVGKTALAAALLDRLRAAPDRRSPRVGDPAQARRPLARPRDRQARLKGRSGAADLDRDMAFDLDHALRYLIAAEGSDLHLKVPSYPLIRLHGRLEAIPDTERLYPEDTERALAEMLGENEKVAEFNSENEVDFSYAVEGLGRFRVNAFRQRGSVSIVMRAIPVVIKSVDELGLPEVVTRMAEEERGILLLTGTTGSGKSTTLAAMLDHMNRTMAKHIVTIEDPIEFLHRDRTSIINQREVGADTASFKRALRRVLRQDPDTILIGEMRDEETVHTALSAAETGHLVLSTLHTVDASETINRIIDFFPPHQQQQARAMIAGTLKGIVSQRLVPTADGQGRVACCEILVMTGRVHDMILDPKLTGQLPEVISEGSYYGMQTFDQHLLQHLHAGRITMDDAMRVATSPHDFKLMVTAASKPAEDDGPAATIESPVEEPVVHEPAPVAAHQPPPSAPPMPVGHGDNGHAAGPPPSAPPPGASF
jgi:twitching motility protein PilT